MPDRTYLLKGVDDELVMAYEKYVTGIVSLLGSSHPNIEAEMRKVLEFEINLANVSKGKQHLFNVTLTNQPA